MDRDGITARNRKTELITSPNWKSLMYPNPLPAASALCALFITGNAVYEHEKAKYQQVDF